MLQLLKVMGRQVSVREAKWPNSIKYSQELGAIRNKCPDLTALGEVSWLENINALSSSLLCWKDLFWIVSEGDVQLQSINKVGNASYQQTKNAKDSNMPYFFNLFNFQLLKVLCMTFFVLTS